MTLLSYLWSAPLPALPLVLPNGNMLMFAMAALLLLSASAVWFEYDRVHRTAWMPLFHHGHAAKIRA